MKIKNDESFYNYAKVLSDNEFNKMDEIIDNKIKEATEKISNADFSINPLKVDKEDIGCKYCKFKDICFRKEEDYHYVKKNTNLEFLGGDTNA